MVGSACNASSNVHWGQLPVLKSQPKERCGHREREPPTRRGRPDPQGALRKKVFITYDNIFPLGPGYKT